MLKRFFVAFNRSPRALVALEAVCFLASLTCGRLHLGHVTEILHAPEMLYNLATQTPLPEWMRSDKPMRETA